MSGLHRTLTQSLDLPGVSASWYLLPVAFNPFTVRDFPVFAGFFIFVEGAERVADEELLARFGYADGMRRVERSELLGLDRRRSAEYVGGVRHFVVMAETAGWKVIADDFLYALWHQNSTQSTICDLAQTHDILCFSDGDVDQSHSLRRFKGGQLVRELIVDDDMRGTGQQLLLDFGDPLPAELELPHEEIRKYFQAVARASGFDINDAVDSARMWLGEPLDPSSNAAHEGEAQRRTGSWRT